MAEEFIPIYVPASMAPAILRQVASSIEKENAVALESGDAPGSEGVNGGWINVAREELDQFLVGLGPDEWDVLLALAELHDKKPTPGEIAERLNISTDQLGGRLGPIARRTRAAGLPPLIVRRKSSKGPWMYMPYPLPSVVLATAGAQPAPAGAHDTPDHDRSSR